MDLTQLSDEELQSMLNMGSFAAGQELANRRASYNPMRDMSAIERENLRNAIARNLASDPQGTIRTFNIPFVAPEDDDYENIQRFVEAPDYRNIFQKGLDFYRESPQTRLGIGALLGGLPGAVASFFAPKVFDTVSEGIGSIFGPRVDMSAVQRGIESARDDDSQEGISSFDAAVSAGIQAAEDDI
jgi:hypothetical protein|tara:strand:- start:87 stop:644 length:558 start_codon:yes stop_codon:yes gene_type:complete